MSDDTDQPTSRRSFCVLIVEDEFLIAIDLQAGLEARGHTVIGPSGSVEAALRLLETERPDVAVLDVNLRGLFVTPVAERLRSLDIPFVVTSAYASLDFDTSQILIDAQLIGKPINEQLLVDALHRVVV